MNPTETFSHRKDTAANRYADCRCTAVAVRSVADGETWGSNCPAALREALDAERARDTGPHITPALMRRIEALGFVPGSGEPVGWLVAELERLKADHTALLLGVGHPMWLPSVADAVDHPDQFNATPDEVLVRVRAVVAERDELAATLANERGEGEPPVDGFHWSHGRRAWVYQPWLMRPKETGPERVVRQGPLGWELYMDGIRTDAEYVSARASMADSPAVVAARSAGGGGS